MDGLYACALVASFYDRNKDYIDCFIPFLLEAITSDISNTAQMIQGRIKVKHKIDIPIHSIKTLAHSSKRKKFIEVHNKIYHLTDEGKEYVKSISVHEETKQEINCFLNELKKYIKNHGYSYTTVDVQSHFENYMNRNLKSLQMYIGTPSFQLTQQRRLRQKSLVVKKCYNLL